MSAFVYWVHIHTMYVQLYANVNTHLPMYFCLGPDMLLFHTMGTHVLSIDPIKAQVCVGEGEGSAATGIQ